jgi:hypothetical protein
MVNLFGPCLSYYLSTLPDNAKTRFVSVPPTKSIFKYYTVVAGAAQEIPQRVLH